MRLRSAVFLFAFGVWVEKGSEIRETTPLAVRAQSPAAAVPSTPRIAFILSIFESACRCYPYLVIKYPPPYPPPEKQTRTPKHNPDFPAPALFKGLETP